MTLVYSSCGSTVSQNQTFFRNPDFPNKYRPATGSDVCQIRIRKQGNNSQLRLNFITFDIDGPSPPVGTGTAIPSGVEAGICRNDMLTISAQGAGIPSLCGNLDGQHSKLYLSSFNVDWLGGFPFSVYLEFGSSETITLNILLGPNNLGKGRYWNVEILMIPSSAAWRAPAGCSQYFQGLTGQVTSFNYIQQQHMANLGYSICVRLEEGMHSIDVSSIEPKNQEQT